MRKASRFVLSFAVGVVGVGFLSVARDASAVPGAPFQRVLVFLVDGLRQADISDPALSADIPNILALQQQGLTYSRCQSMTPTDSFPGALAIMTGAGPKTTGVYYDDTWCRSFIAPGGTLASARGAECPWTGAINLNDVILSAGGTPGFNAGSIDTTKLPQRVVSGALVPVFPHDYLKVNTIFELAHAAGLRTYYSDKHMSYEVMNGPSGAGLSDFYANESDALETTNNPADPVNGTIVLTDSPSGKKASKDPIVSYGEDELRVTKLLDQIAGKDSRGNSAAVPNLMGMNWISINSTQKIAGSGGGIDVVGGVESVSTVLHQAYQRLDKAVGRVVQALKDQNLYDSTLIVFTSKHGNAPRLGAATVEATNWLTGPLGTAGIAVAQATQDAVALLWLQDQTKTAQAWSILEDMAETNPTLIFDVLGRDRLVAAGFGDPQDPNDDRAPDFIVKLADGAIISSSTKRSEHGGFSLAETHVPIVLSGGASFPAALKNTASTARVQSRQIAPTIAEALGLSPAGLQGVLAEKTQALPGFLNSAPSVPTPTAVPPTAGVGQTVTFSVAPFDADGDALTISWDFGDGSAAGVGASTSHAFATAGTHHATVSVGDGKHSAVTAGVDVVVSAPDAGVGPDSDGDGFSDAVEKAAGSSPTIAGSTPATGTPVAGTSALTVASLAIKLRFSSAGGDQIALRGSLPIGEAPASDSMVVVDVGGFARAFHLDAKGRGVSGAAAFSFGKSKNGATPFAFDVAKADAAAILAASSGLADADASKQADTVRVTVVFGGKIYRADVAVSYTATQGVKGFAKSE